MLTGFFLSVLYCDLFIRETQGYTYTVSRKKQNLNWIEFMAKHIKRYSFDKCFK